MYILGSILFVILIGFRKLKQYLTRKMDLKDKVILITGASSGIGEQLAHQLYEHGCKLILASRNLNELNRVKNDIMSTTKSQFKNIPTTLRLDLTNLDSLPDFVNRIIKTHGHIDILINNAGIGFRGNIVDTTVEVHQKVMLTNYFGPIELTRLVVLNMIERKSGHIVFMNSIQALAPIPYRSPYGSSKGALYSFADCLRCELNELNVKVLSVFLTWVKTRLSYNALTATGESYEQLTALSNKGMCPKYVAKETVDAILHQKRDLTLTRYYENAFFISRLLSSTMYDKFLKLLKNQTLKTAQLKSKL